MNDLQTQMREDHSKVESSENELIKERAALQDKLEQVEADLNTFKNRESNLHNEIKSLKNNNRQLNREVNQSFMRDFRDKVGEIQSDSKLVSELQSREVKLILENK